MGHASPETTAAYVHLAPEDAGCRVRPPPGRCGRERRRRGHAAPTRGTGSAGRLRRRGRTLPAARIPAAAPQRRRSGCWRCIRSCRCGCRRPTWARLADVKRTGAWPFLTWSFRRGSSAPRRRSAAGQDVRRPLSPVDRPPIAGRRRSVARWRVSSAGARTGAARCVPRRAGPGLPHRRQDPRRADRRRPRRLRRVRSPRPPRCVAGREVAQLGPRRSACTRPAIELRICQRPPRLAGPGQATSPSGSQAISQPGSAQPRCAI